MNFIKVAQAAVENPEAASETTSGFLSSLGISPSLFIFQLVNFAIVAVILWYLILKPLVKKLNERQNIIARGLKDAKKAEAKLAQANETREKQIRQAKKEAEMILVQAKKEAEIEIQKMKAKTEKEIEAITNAGKETLAREKIDLLKDLKKETAELVQLALEKILKEKIDKEKDKKLIEKTIKQIK